MAISKTEKRILDNRRLAELERAIDKRVESERAFARKVRSLRLPPSLAGRDGYLATKKLGAVRKLVKRTDLKSVV